MGLSKKNRYVACLDCGCRLEMNGVCKICGHEDVPPLPGMVPNLTGLTQQAATALLTDPECQLTLGNVTTDHDDIIAANLIIDSEPAAGTQLTIGAAVNISVSLGPGT